MMFFKGVLQATQQAPTASSATAFNALAAAALKRRRAADAPRLPRNFHGGIPGIPGPSGAPAPGTPAAAGGADLARAGRAGGAWPASRIASDSDLRQSAQHAGTVQRDSGDSATVIDLTADDDHVGTAEPRSRTQGSARQITSGAVPQRTEAVNGVQQGWQCVQCTMANPMTVQTCSVCGKSRPLGRLIDTVITSGPIKQSEGGGAASTGLPAAGGLRWECKFCTLANPAANSHCAACEHWRYASVLATP